MKAAVTRGRGKPLESITGSLNGKQGTELADLIVNKIKQAVNAITFR